MACLEEIAYANGWIDRDHLLERAKYFGKTGYGQYLYTLAGRQPVNVVDTTTCPAY